MIRTITLLLFLGVAFLVLAQVPPGPEGSWQGTLNAGQQLRLALTLSKDPEGTYTGRVDSLDQGSTIPIDVVTVSGESVRLELKSVVEVRNHEHN